jgi:hypothetical protein
MHEARIEVTENGVDFQVRLLDVGKGGEILASGTTLEKSLTHGFKDTEGFQDILLDNQALTASTLKTEYSQNSTFDTAEKRQKFGKYLYQLLTPGNIKQEWDQLRAQHENDGLTTLLEIHPIDWRSLPWELLYSGQMHLFHDQKHAIGLRIPNGEAASYSFNWPLRMLVIIGGDCGIPIECEDELMAIKRGIFQFSLRIDLSVLKPPLTIEVVENEIKRFRPHILHFVGHGTSNNGGELQLEGLGNNAFWNRDEIRAALTGLNSDEIPRIVLINACQSAGAGGILGDTAVAAAFEDIRCPAIIAMRGDIFGNTARTFAECFYKQLAELGINRPDLAFCQAVAKISKPNIKQRVWSLPRIYFQETVQAVFPVNGECGGFDKLSRKYDDLKELRPFVDRKDERFDLYQAVNAWLNESDPGHNILIVRGADKVGKTWLLKALVYVASLREFQAAYCEFSGKVDGGNAYGLDDFLNLLRYGKRFDHSFFAKPLIFQKTDPNPFADFDSLNTSEAMPSLNGTEDMKTPLLEAMVKGIKETAKIKPVLLAFDNIGNFLKDDWRMYIAESFFGAIDQDDGQIKPRIIIAASDSEWEKYNLEKIPAKLLELKSPKSELFKEIVIDYFFHQLGKKNHDSSELKEVVNLIDNIAKLKVNKQLSCKLDELPDIRKFLFEGFCDD